MEAATLSMAFTPSRRHLRPHLPHRPIHASRGPNQTSPLRISSTDGSRPLHLLHHPPRCALLSGHEKSTKEEEDGGEHHPRRPGFDVFLSFHGHDVRHRIVDHLYAALLRKGTKPFKDDTEMERGLDVEDAISTAIGDSSIYLLLLSPGYASSAFCMDEAVEIMQRCGCGGGGGGGGRIALPVFYLISPDDVCLPTAGCFKEHFLSHFDEFTYGRVQGWMDAFSSIGKISGWVHENGRSEALLVEEVSTTIQKLVLEMRSTRHDHFTKYSPPPPLSWMQLASSTSAQYNDQHMELEYFEPQVISSTQGNDRIVRIPKPDHGHSLQPCLVAQHYSRPGARGQLEMVINDDITAIATEARSLWKDENIHVEPLDAANNINGYMIIRFLNEDTRNWVLESSPCLINGTQFFMRKWKGPSPSSSSLSLLTIPMWVRLYNVPEEYMNPKGLSYIASALGKPMYVDRATADCCYNHISGSRGKTKTPAYAKVCVEISPKDQGIDTFMPAAERTMVIAIGDERENLVIVNAVYQLEEDGPGD